MGSMLIKTFVAKCDGSEEKTALTLLVDKRKGLCLAENVYNTVTGTRIRRQRTKSRIRSYRKALILYRERIATLKAQAGKVFEHSDPEAAHVACLDFPG